MKPRPQILLLVSAVAVVVALFVWSLSSLPAHPVALLRVMDAAGKPIAGAVIVPDGLRPKAGAADGHYQWRSEQLGVTNNPAITDADGYARVPYPKYLLERIETGEISFTVNRPTLSKMWLGLSSLDTGVPSPKSHLLLMAPPALVNDTSRGVYPFTVLALMLAVV